MKKLLALSVALALGTSSVTSLAQDDEGVDVLSIARQADKATKAARKVTYDFEFFGTGYIKPLMPRITGSAQLLQVTDQNDSMSRVTARIEPQDGTDGIVTKLTAARDGKNLYLIDMVDESFISGSLADGAGELMGQAGAGIMIEYIHPGPFEDEINADSLKFEGTEIVGDVLCDVLHVVYAGGESKARWYFGRKDHLPRRVERLFVSPDGESGSTVHILTNLNAKAKLTEAAFVLEAPKGFAVNTFEAAPMPPGPELLAIGSLAPNWELATPSGEMVSLKSLRGNIVLMDFWATWCGPCKRAMPGVQALHEYFADKPVKILGISTWENPEGDPQAYMTKQEYTYGLLVKGDEVAEKYKVSGIPTFYVIGPEGKVIKATVGYEPDAEEQLREFITAALKKMSDKG